MMPNSIKLMQQQNLPMDLQSFFDNAFENRPSDKNYKLAYTEDNCIQRLFYGDKYEPEIIHDGYTLKELSKMPFEQWARLIEIENINNND